MDAAVTVATDLPVSGSDASDGKPTENGAKLAVTQATEKKLLGGCTIKLVNKDNSSVALGKHDPQQGAQNITELAGDSSVLGVIGPFNSNVALAELPISNKANLVQISPSNTNPGLTIAGSNPDINTTSLKPTGNTTYFRVCTTDIGQGKALAEEATDAYESARAAVAGFVGVDDDELVWTRNATEGINLVAAGLSDPECELVLRPGDEVVVTEMEHHANLLPWQRACASTGAGRTSMHCESPSSST